MTLPIHTESDTLVGRELLLDVAGNLFMQDGFDGVSMQQIATAANMTKGSPYYHFQGKDDLFVHVFLAKMQAIHTGIAARLETDEPFRERLINSFVHLLTTTDPGVLRLLDDFKRVAGPGCKTTHSDFSTTPNLLLEFYEASFTEAARGPIKLSLSPERAARALLAMQMGTLHMSLMHSDEQSISPARAREVATETIDLFLYGATTRSDS